MVVIGDPPERAARYAQRHGHSTFGPPPLGGEDALRERAGQFIRGAMRRGCTFIDLGRDPEPSGNPGALYALQDQILTEAEYPRTLARDDA